MKLSLPMQFHVGSYLIVTEGNSHTCYYSCRSGEIESSRILDVQVVVCDTCLVAADMNIDETSRH